MITTTSTNAAEPPMPPLPLTLILAATPSRGIGRAGTLPWPPHKLDMAYFARVTRRVPPSSSSSSSSSSSATPPSQAKKLRNAVIMGRKTWDSIPARFRPLRGRVNVVVSRQEGLLGPEEGKGAWGDGEVVVRAGSLAGAVELLGGVGKGEAEGGGQGAEEVGGAWLRGAWETLAPFEIGHVFVIGGSSVYGAALGLPQARRVLLTKIEREFECDTFFPLDIEGEEGKKLGWVRKSKKELEEFVGEEIGDGLEEGGVPFEFCMFEREGVE